MEKQHAVFGISVEITRWPDQVAAVNEQAVIKGLTLVDILEQRPTYLETYSESDIKYLDAMRRQVINGECQAARVNPCPHYILRCLHEGNQLRSLHADEMRWIMGLEATQITDNELTDSAEWLRELRAVEAQWHMWRTND